MFLTIFHKSNFKLHNTFPTRAGAIIVFTFSTAYAKANMRYYYQIQHIINDKKK